MTFEVHVAGHGHWVTIEPAGPVAPAGGRFRVRLRTTPPGEEPDAVETVEVDVRLTPAGMSLVDVVRGRVVDAAVTEQGGAWRVDLRAVALTAIVNGRLGHGRAARAPASGSHQLSAPMPGRVLRVLVKPGDDVAARQGLVVIEAMKMENELTAARAGRVREVTVEPGVTVEAGRVLVVLE